MYRVGYIDDDPQQYENYAKKLKRRYPDMELILLKNCTTKAEFVEKICDERIDVLLIDYKMAKNYGFNGTSLISYINDKICDIECFILTAVDQEQISDGLVMGRNRYSKEIFDTEGDDPKRVEKLNEFVALLRESADVFEVRREQKTKEYRELLEKKKESNLEVEEEEEFFSLYKVLSSYGMIERLSSQMLSSEFEQKLDELLEIGDTILEKYSKK